MKQLAEYIYKNFPEEAAHTITIAEELCRSCFTFTNDWDLEQSSYRIEFDGPIDWEMNPSGDPEFAWQFNRHRSFICLGQAYQMTGDEKYADQLASLLLDWIQKVPLTDSSQNGTWRSLEAGFRGEYWTKAVSYIKDSPVFTLRLQTDYERSLYTHAKYLEQKHSDYKYISNWGVIENHGLFAFALALPNEGKRQHYAALALEHLQKEASMQFMPDGMHWEQSSLYQKEVVHCYLDLFLLARKHGIPLPDSMEETVQNALYAMLAASKPDGHMFLNGDSDDLDMTECFVQGAVYFQDGVLKHASGGMDYESAWLLGLEGIQEYERLIQRAPDFVSRALCDSGHFYLRSGWEEQANLLHFTCGTLGAGHGHSDKLHTDLVMGGRDVLVDAGRYTYRMESGRTDFKDPQAHNTTVMDGRPFIVCRDSWACSKLSQHVNTAYRYTGNYDYVQGGHLGYIKDGVFLNRRVLYIRPDIYVIADEMYGSGPHCYETYFHFNEAGMIRPGRKISTCVNVRQYCDACGAVDIFFCSDGFAKDKAQILHTKSYISRHYNQKAENDCLTVRQQADNFVSLYTVFSGGSVRDCEKLAAGSALKSEIYQDSQAEALRIATEHTEYILIICHEEVCSPTDLVTAGGCSGYGNVILFDRQKETMGGTVLHW